MRCRQGQEEGAPISSKPQIKKGLWSPEEDEKLINYMRKNGLIGGYWSYVAKQAGLQRSGKSCRLRWINYLRPGLKHGGISFQEEQLIIRLHSIMGSRWSQIATHLPGRTDNKIKNYWNSCIKKKLKSKQYSFHCSSTEANGKQCSGLSCSSTEANGNNNTKSHFPLQYDHTYNTNSVSQHARDGYTGFYSDKPLDAMALQSLDDIFNAMITAENQHSCVQDVVGLKYKQVQEQNNEFAIDLDPTNNQLISCSQLWIDSPSTHNSDSFPQAFTFPSQQAQGHSYKTANSSRCDQSIDRWATLPPHEAPGSANNSLGCTSAVPSLVEISNSLKGKIENDGHIITETENKFMTENFMLSTASSGMCSWSAGYCHSNAANLNDVYNKVENYVTQLHEMATHESYPPHNSRCSYSTPPIIWADLDQYLKIQSQDEDDSKDLGHLRYDDVKVGAPTYINIDRQQRYQLPPIGGGVRVGDQQDCSTIQNEEAMATQVTATMLGRGGRTANIESEGQVTIWPQDNHMYTTFDVDQIS